jgi:hemerythrin superfamily protein
MTEGQTKQSVIAILEADHREVEAMFAELETGGGDADHRKRLSDQVIMELVRHSVAEEQYLYPAARKALPDGDSIVEHEITEHSEAEKTMDRLDKLSPSDSDFDPVLAELMSQIRHHVGEEEGALFPRLAAACSAEELADLGAKVQVAKKAAPTRPHPMSPDHPPFNKLLDPGAGFVDKLRDALTGRGQD